MFGVVNCALLALSVGYFTLALPLEKKRRIVDEVIQQGAPCEMQSQLGDDVKLAIAVFREVGDEVERGPQLIRFITLGDNVLPGLDERLVGMCPGDIRRLDDHYTGDYGVTNDTRYSFYYEAELISIGDSDTKIFPEMDTDGDNTLSIEELANYMENIYGQSVPEQGIQMAFLNFDTNGDGVVDYSEVQQAMSLSSGNNIAV